MKLQKGTKSHGKWYDDACGTAFALELIGERWSLLIVRELMFGGRRFSDIRAGLPGISAKVLTERLESLERAGILGRRQLPPPASVQVYELTPWGYAAEEPIKALGYWAARSAEHDPTLPLSPASLMLSFRTMFAPDRAAGLQLRGTIFVGDDRFRVEVSNAELSVGRGEAEVPQFTLAAPTASPIAFAVYGKIPFEELEGLGLVLTGSREDALHYVDLFHLPEKVAPPA